MSDELWRRQTKSGDGAFLYELGHSYELSPKLAEQILYTAKECLFTEDQLGEGQRQSYGKRTEDFASTTVVLPLITKQDVERRIYYKKGDRNSNYKHREARDIETMVRLIKSAKAQ